MQSDEQSFLATIQAEPTDLTTKVAYAEWLEERGDIRSEFVRTLVAQATEPSKRKHQTRLRKLRPQCDPLWLAAIGDTPARLKTIARVLDTRQGAHLFEYVKSLIEHEKSLPEGKRLGLNLPCPDSCPDSCITVRHAGTLLDLEVCAHATDPYWSGNLEDDLRKSPEGIGDVCEFIASPEIAPAVRSLYLWTTVAGCGTAGIKLDGYVSGAGQFSNLKRFGTNFFNEDGECIIVSDKWGNGDEEAGVIGKVLAKCPLAEELALPSAPNHEFFAVGVRPIKKLQLKAGAATQDFIRNLSRSDCFPYLETLTYDEYNLREGGTPFDHFAELLRSRALQKVQSLDIGCSSLKAAELRRLRAIRKHGATFRC
jgi:uncharacterized protein (TIGR02996 family)